MSDSGKTKERVNMENAILEMQQNIRDGFFVAFVSANKDHYFPVTKSDDLAFLNDNRISIHRKNGWTSIINLDLIVEICIRRELS